MNRFNPLPLLTSDRPVDRRPFRALQPVPFGRPDPALAKLVVLAVAEATAPTRRLTVRHVLRHLGA